jgi:L-threonylcarbamoyladenylate synthase
VPHIVALDPLAPSPSAIADAAVVLRRGGLVAFPTETVYGLGGRALDPASIGRIFAAKGRPRAHPLIAHVLGEDDARPLAAEWSERASRLAQAFWPGPLTLVVPRAARVPADVAGGADSIAVRAPSGAIARGLIAALGEPIAAPSANRYQTISPTLAEHVVKSLGDRVDLVLDGGPCAAGIESTVVDVRGDRARVLRPGALPIAALRAIEPSIEAAAASVAEESARRPSPGMDPRHYAPKTPLTVVSGSFPDVANAGAILRAPRDLPLDAARVRVLGNDAEAYAAGLYAALHELDELGLARIFVEAPPPGEAWDAVRDRLLRASS